MPTAKLSRRLLQQVQIVERPSIIYDDTLKGFGLKLTPPTGRNPRGTRTWIVEYRPGAGGRRIAKRRLSLGSTDTLTAEQARDQARSILAAARLGADPAAARSSDRNALPLRDLAKTYSAEHEKSRKPRTNQLYDGYWRNYILPSLGHLSLPNIGRSQVIALRSSAAATGGVTANRVMTLLRHFSTWAVKAGHAPAGYDPCNGITSFQENGRERFLALDEFKRLGSALKLAEGYGIPWGSESTSKHAPKNATNRLVTFDRPSVAAVRLLMLTGARLREILHLRWVEVDLERGMLNLHDTKTGRSVIVLNDYAVGILSRLWEERQTTGSTVVSPYVFPASDPLRPKSDLKRLWSAVIREANLPGLRIHDLRHSFASIGVSDGIGLPIIGKLLGHKHSSTPAKYAHFFSAPIRHATNTVGQVIHDLTSQPDAISQSIT